MIQAKVDLNNDSEGKISLLGEDEVQYVMDEIRKSSEKPLQNNNQNPI